MSITHFSIMYLILVKMKLKTTLIKSPVFKFVKKNPVYNFLKCLQPQQNDQNRSHY